MSDSHSKTYHLREERYADRARTEKKDTRSFAVQQQHTEKKAVKNQKGVLNKNYCAAL